MAITKNNKKLNLLLISDHSIQSQFIQREVEKTALFNFIRQAPKEYLSEFNKKDIHIMLISYLILDDSFKSHLASNQDLSYGLIVYDIPNQESESLFSELFNLKGILAEESPIDHLARCLEAVANGDLWLPRKVMTEMLGNLRPYAINTQEINTLLTKREKQIFELLVQGKSNLEISEFLYVAESTVKTHIYKLYKKLNVKCRKEAIQKFAQNIHI